jgi:hypothetical protein
MITSRLQIPPTTLEYKDQPLSPEQRYEFKLVTEWGSPALGRSWLRLHPEGFRAAHPPRTVNNLYLDTADLRCFNDNLMGVSDRLKIRLRWYGQPDITLINNPTLELKIKKNMLGDKRRQKLACTMDLSRPFVEILKLIRSQAGAPWQPWLQAAVQPTIINHYHREYYVSPDGAIRATLDYGLKTYNQRLSSRPNLHRAMPANDTLLIEVKAKPQDHERLQRAMGFFPIQRGRNSKYVNGLSGGPL